MTARILALVFVGIILGAGPLAPHHAWPVTYDKLVTVKGTVTSYAWGNPRTMFGLEVTTAGGQVQRWNVGGPSVDRMARNGWGRDTLKPGDVITASGYQFADGQNVLRLEKVTMPDGKEMFLYGRRQAPLGATSRAPRGNSARRRSRPRASRPPRH